MTIKELFDYIPFAAVILSVLGVAELRLNKKVDKTEFVAYRLTVERMEARLMRIEGYLIGKALTHKEAEKIAQKNSS